MRNPFQNVFKCDLDEDWEPERVLEPKVPTAEELERDARAKEYWDRDVKDWHDEEFFFDCDDEPQLPQKTIRAARGPSINPKAPAFVPSRSPSPTGTAINPQAPEFIPSRSASPTSKPINPLATPFVPSQPAMEAGPSAPPHAANPHHHVHSTLSTSGPSSSAYAYMPPHGDANWRSALASRPRPHGAARPAPALRAYIRNPPFSFHDDPRMDPSGRPRSSRLPTRESVRALNESWRRALAVNEAAAVARAAAEVIRAEAAEGNANAAGMVAAEAEAANAGAADMETGGGAFGLPPPEQMVWRFNRPGSLGEVLRETDPREVAQKSVITYRDVMAYLERRAYVAQQERSDRWFNAARRGEMRRWIGEVRVEREREGVEREKEEKG